MVDSVPPDEGCEALDGEMNDEEWDKNGNKNIADSDDIHNVIKLGGGISMQCYMWEKFVIVQYDPLIIKHAIVQACRMKHCQEGCNRGVIIKNLTI